MSFTLTTSGAILLKAGAGSNSTINISAATLTKFSDMAEATLSARTRQDWVANYGSVGANYKGILDDTVSSMAAMNLIAYDMSGYTSRLESQIMLDVLRDSVNANIEVLKDDKHKSVMGV